MQPDKVDHILSVINAQPLPDTIIPSDARYVNGEHISYSLIWGKRRHSRSIEVLVRTTTKFATLDLKWGIAKRLWVPAENVLVLTGGRNKVAESIGRNPQEILIDIPISLNGNPDVVAEIGGLADALRDAKSFKVAA